jgi:type IV pilus assembly protein PilM
MAKGKLAVGLDIGSGSIKLCQLKPGKKGNYQLISFGMVQLPPEAIVDGALMNSTAVVDGIQELFASQKIKHKEVATSVSGHSVIIKKINLPQMTPEELEESIQWEAEQYIPFDINDVNIDVQILNTESTQAGQMDVLLVAAKKDMVNDYTEVIASAGLTPVVVDIDAFAVQNQFEINYEVPRSETVVLVNIGASVTNINVLANGISTFTRDISIGGGQFTDAVQKALNVSYDEAEALKLGGGAQRQRRGGPSRGGAGAPDRVRVDRQRDPAVPRLLRGHLGRRPHRSDLPLGWVLQDPGPGEDHRRADRGARRSDEPLPQH